MTNKKLYVAYPEKPEPTMGVELLGSLISNILNEEERNKKDENVKSWRNASSQIKELLEKYNLYLPSK